MSLNAPKSDWADWVLPTVLELNELYPNFGWGTYPGHDPSIHNAADGMVPLWALPGGKARGRVVANHIASQAFMRPRGGWYVIHWGEIWSMTRPQLGWLPYFDRNNANPSRSHKNHVHWSAYLNKPAGVVLPGKPVPVVTTPSVPLPEEFSPGWSPARKDWIFYLDKQGPGVTKSISVWLIQKALGMPVRDGNWSEDVKVAVSKRQRAWGDTPANCDGYLGAKQAKKLFGSLVPVRKSSL